jgi:serine/threonine protein kinase
MSEGRLIKNKLRIVRQVGRGGMGFVYEAFHEGLRVTRAIKQIVGDL